MAAENEEEAMDVEEEYIPEGGIRIGDIYEEKLNRVKLVEKEKDDLEPAMRDALGFIRLENDKVKQHRVSLRYILDAERNITTATEKKNEIEASATDLTDKLKEVTGQRKEKEAEILEKGKDFDKIQKEIEVLEEEFEKLELEDATLREDIKGTNARRKKIKAQIAKENENKEKLENLPEENKKKIDECIELREKLEKKVDEEEENYEAAMATLKANTQVYQDEKAEHESKLVGRSNRSRRASTIPRKNLEKIKAEITRLEVEIKSSDRNLKKCTDKIESFQAEVTEMETNMRTWNERVKHIQYVEAEEIIGVFNKKQEESEKLQEEINKIKKEMDAISKEETELKSSLIEVDQQLQKWEDAVKDNSKKVSYWKSEIKKLVPQEVPGEEVPTLPELSEEEILAINMEELNYEITAIDENLAKSKPNMAAIAEYKKKEEVYLERVSELDKITGARDEQRKHHDDLRKQRLNDFMDGFAIITGKLKEMYQMITLGGDAELELVDSLDPFAEGIVFSVRPPKKSWKNISNLSGGEKTLSSLALVFALHYYKPTPLYVMDEIDAALDFKNVSIVANYIKERTRNAQFIIISLRSNMFELADRLVGIYKTDNCTKSVTINPHLIEETAPQSQAQPNITQMTMTPGKANRTMSSAQPLAENNTNSLEVL